MVNVKEHLRALWKDRCTVDEESVNETLAAIRKVREEAETLKNPEISADFENRSAAVAMGYGTNTMYGDALGYEAIKTNSEIDAMIADYSGKMREAESQIVNATTDADREYWFGEYGRLESEMNAAVAERKQLYSEKVSELFNGMAARYPEAAAALEKASRDYDLMGTLMQVQNFDWDAYADEAVAQANWDIQDGMYMDMGLAQGITSNQGMPTSAMSAVCNQVVAIGNSIVNYGAGYSMGVNIGLGMAAGIRSQIGAVRAAGRALASAAAIAMQTRLKIHSPSDVTYDFGDYTGIGFVNGILANRKKAASAMEKVVSSAENALNASTWSDIALFAGLEHDSLLNDAKDAMKISDSDIRKIRDLAEREVINHFTTAKVEVQMHNTNEIKSNMDLDGIVDYLGDKVSERLEAVAEGVYT